MKLTKTQQGMYDLLADGQAHAREELIKLLWDDQNTDPKMAVAFHVSEIRKVIGERGLDITVRGRNGSVRYTLVRPVTPGE